MGILGSFSELIPNDNIYVIANAADLPDQLDQWRLYHLLFDPGAGVGLYYSPDSINLVRIAAGGGGGGIDPGTVDGSTTYWDTGTVAWEENTAVRWIDPTNLLLDNAIAINWLDASLVSREMLIFEPVGGAGGVVGFAGIGQISSQLTSSTSFVDVTGATLTPANVGDEYLLLTSAFNVCSASLSGGNGCQITLDDVVMFESFADWEGGGTGLTEGFPWQYMNWFTYAAGDLQVEHHTNAVAGDVRTNQARISVLNLTDLGAGNHAKDRMTLSTLNMGVAYANSTAGITIGNGSDDWLILVCATIDTPSAASINIFVGLNDGTIDVDLYRMEFERTTDSYCIMGSFLAVGVPSTTYTVSGRTISGTAVMKYASIIAIRLNAFAEYTADFGAGPVVVPGVTDFTLISSSPTINVTAPTGDWIWFGGLNDNFGGFSQSGGTAVEIELNSGGFNEVTWDKLDAFYNANDPPNDEQYKMLFPTAVVNIANGDTLDWRLRHDPVGGVGSETFTNMFVAGFTLQLLTGTETFVVGDPGFRTQIDGSSLSIAGSYTLPVVDGAAGTRLTTDGAGVVSFVAPTAHPGGVLPASTVIGSILIGTIPNWVEQTAYIFPAADGSTDQILKTDGAGDVSFVNHQRARYEGMTSEALVTSDFFDPVDAIFPKFEGGRAIGGGGGVIFEPATIDKSDHPGVWGATTGVGAAGRGFFIGGVNNGQNVGGGGIARVGSWVRTPAVLSDAVDEYVLRAGVFSVNLPNTIAEGIGFEYQFDQNGGRWQGLCEDGVGETSSDTGITVAVNTWYRLEHEVNAAGTSVEYFIDGISVATVAANIPAGVAFDLFYNTHIMKLAGTNARAFYIDQYYIYCEVIR